MISLAKEFRKRKKALRSGREISVNGALSDVLTVSTAANSPDRRWCASALSAQ